MCAEDVVLQHVGNDWICGPAADDANFVAASVPMPDTALLHAEPMPLAALVLPVAVALASVIRAWRQIR